MVNLILAMLGTWLVTRWWYRREIVEMEASIARAIIQLQAIINEGEGKPVQGAPDDDLRG